MGRPRTTSTGFCRRLLNGGAVALALAITAPSLAWAQPEPDRVVLQLQWRHQFQFAGYYAAAEQGYYREAGLEVEIREAPADENPVERVVAGEAEFGVSASDLIVHRAAGRPVVVLATIFQHSPLVLLASRDMGVDTVHDLVGKRVMMEHHAAELIAYLEIEGIRRDDMVLLPHTHDPGPLLRGEVHALSAYSTDEPFLVREAGIDHRIFSPRAAGIDFYGDTLFTTEAEIARNPERVAAFVDASLRGWRWALDNPEQTIDLILEHYSRRHSREHLLFEAEHTRRLILPHIVDVGFVNPARWRHIADVYASLGMIPADLPLEGFLPPAPDEDAWSLWLYATHVGALAIIVLISLVSLRYYRLNRALAREIGERKRIEAELTRTARTDPLTGLVNRRYFMEVLGHEIARSRRYRHQLSLLAIDIDEFKRVNDTWGHLRGDDVLCRVAQVAAEQLRDTDTIGRIGGEEFVVLLPETPPEQAASLAERLRAAVASQVHSAGAAEIRLTVSIGIAELQPRDDALTLLGRADRRLYAAKRRGRDRVVSDDADEARAAD